VSLIEGPARRPSQLQQHAEPDHDLKIRTPHQRTLTVAQVEENFARGQRDNDPDWVYWLNREEIDVMAGRCYTELRVPRRAEPLLREAVDRYNHALVRENVLYLSWLAESYVQLDEIDQAATVGTHALELAMHTGSARADSRIRCIASILKRYKSIPKVTEFFDLYRDKDAANAS
jgi:hypothetical protein